MRIYHNPRCTKSREALELLKSNGINPEVVLYLDNPPKAAELSDLLKKLGIPAEDLVRKGEDEFAPFRGKKFTRLEWIQVLCEHPKLIERPIVVNGDRAIVARPADRLLLII